MKYLNLGCGQRFHPEWVNVDFASSNKNVIAHNLLNGIPFNPNEFDVVYHSHTLEHFSKEDGKKFMSECYRVLKPTGIIRVAVPDLEQIVKNYLKYMEGALQGNLESFYNYEWIMLEMYDQTVRTQSGGEMAKYFYQDEIKNEQFVYSRVGEVGKNIRQRYLDSKNKKVREYIFKPEPLLKRIVNPSTYIRKVKNIFFKNEFAEIEKNKKYNDIGRFRLGGEIHQWMYDRYSLLKLLTDMGFFEVTVKTAFDSNIPKWNSYELESKGGIIYKPDSLFMEAFKK